METIEAAYQSHLVKPTDNFVTVEKMEVDFTRMKMKKKKGEVGYLCSTLVRAVIFCKAYVVCPAV